MAKQVDGVLTSTVTDEACDALLPHVSATYSDDVAEALLDIAATRPYLSAASRRVLTAVVSDANVPARTRVAAGWTIAGSGTFDAAALAAVDYIQPYGARALVAAAARAGHTPSQHELGRAIN